jgi:hypothetical protein
MLNRARSDVAKAQGTEPNALRTLDLRARICARPFDFFDFGKIIQTSAAPKKICARDPRPLRALSERAPSSDPAPA